MEPLRNVTVRAALNLLGASSRDSGPPGEARTPRKDCCAKDHTAPNHISKMVLSTVHFGPPEEARTVH